MKPSKYTFVFPFPEDESKHVMYSSRTNALALIKNDDLCAYERFCSAGQPLRGELEKDLISGGFLLDDDVDEKQLLRYNLLRHRYSTSTLSLTIAPTADCNFRCAYCYEKKSITNEYMSKQVQEKLVEFVKSQAPTISALSVAWYGGEPLLALDIIANLTGKFKEICQENKVHYSSSVVTNGYLLTSENIERIKTFDIQQIQITLDGPPEIHNKRRPLADGSPTFDAIVNNLKNAKGKLSIPISLRVNTDKKNVEHVDEIISILEKNDILDFVHPYLGYVANTNDAYSNMLCLPLHDYAEIDFEFKKRMSESNRQFMLSAYPHLRACFCGADSLNSYVVNVDGSLCKCWNDVGIEEKRVADLMEEVRLNPNALLSYMMYDPTEDQGCSECKYLPVCMGGCPSRRTEHLEERCDIMKHKMSDYMEIIPKLLYERKYAPSNPELS